MMKSIIITLLTGALAVLIGELVGVGWEIVIVPIFTSLLGLDQKLATHKNLCYKCDFIWH